MIYRIITLVFSSLILQSWAEEVTLEIDDGQLRGNVSLTAQNVTYYTFYGIPYGQPPVGELRFQAPKPAEKWEGVREARYFQKYCHQVGASNDYVDEDCLVLNVFTPSVTCDSATLPVMVFIHGGAFLNGNSWVGPEFFMNEKDVILVSINYRLGPYGFMSTGDTVVPGNAGLKDQVLALQWVQNNIKYFCGDPDQVTIFGISAGGASVSYHLLSPKSAGLFKAAIIGSGSALSPWAYQRNETEITKQLANLISGDEVTDSSDILKVLLAANASDIDEAAEVIGSQDGAHNSQLQQGFFFAPVIEAEHEDAFLTDYQYESFKKGNINQVPIIIGIASEEYLAFSNLDGIKYYVETYNSELSLYPPRDLHANSSAALAAGAEIRDFYELSTNGTFDDTHYARGIKFFSDTCFARAIVKQAALQSQYTDVYFYMFSYSGIMGDNSMKVEGTDRVRHGEEGNYLFSTTLSSSKLDNTNSSLFPESDILTQKRLIKLWTNFAKHQNPTPEEDELFGLTWTKVDVSSGDLQYLNINETLSIELNPRGKEKLSFWDTLYDTYGVEPYDTY